MRGKFEKSVCKCPRCVAKRRIRFLAFSGVCIALGAGCYILVSYSVARRPATSLNAPETAPEGTASDAIGIPLGNEKSVSRALARLETSWKQADTKPAHENLSGDGSAEGSRELTKGLTPLDGRRGRATFPPSNPCGESPMPHTRAWQTVLLAEPPKSVSEVVQGTSPLDGAKPAVTPAGSSPRPLFGEPALPSVVGTNLPKDDGKAMMAYSSDSYQLLPRWLKEGSQLPESEPLKADSDRARFVGTAGREPESTPQAMAGVKPPEPKEILPPQPKETGMASRTKPEEAHSIVEESPRPRGYLTIESETGTRRNPEAEEPRPKRRDHPPGGQDHSLKVQDPPVAVQVHPLKVPDHPSEPEEKSADLRRFASAFLEADQTGNIADQHRFYADSVHFYREGDLSWTGVEAATRRYHQQRQNIRFGTEGTAAVKGPVDGGFYVVEQPVSWSRAEGSRLTRGRSVLRLRVVPTNRGDWKITSIEEIGQ
jgi:hypothetical protein